MVFSETYVRAFTDVILYRYGNFKKTNSEGYTYTEYIVKYL